MKFLGYRRENGYFGLRNHLLIIPVSVCATACAERIAALTPGAVSIHNQHGCSQIGVDLDITRRTLIGFGLNNNVGAALVVGLGCEGVQAADVAEAIAASGKTVASLVIQENGGTLKSIAKGAELASAMMLKLSAQTREECDISNIVLGLECGGSDPTSGLASNPTIGHASTKLVELGGSSILSETTEVIGAEHLLAERFADSGERAKFMRMVGDVEKRAVAMGVDLREGQPTPGNKEGGISTIEEKSLGCMYKAGHSPFQGALEYAQLLPIKKPGLYFMDSPGQDIDSITGMVASGANVIVFSTGRGTPTGSPIAPVIKVTGNDATFQKMEDNIDLNAGTIISQGRPVAELGEALFNMVMEVAGGRRLTKAEILGHHEFGIYRLTGAF